MQLVEFVQWSAAAAVSVKHMTPQVQGGSYLCSSAGQRPILTTHTMTVNVRVENSFTQTQKTPNELND